MTIEEIKTAKRKAKKIIKLLNAIPKEEFNPELFKSNFEKNINELKLRKLTKEYLHKLGINKFGQLYLFLPHSWVELVRNTSVYIDVCKLYRSMGVEIREVVGLKSTYSIP